MGGSRGIHTAVNGVEALRQLDAPDPIKPHMIILDVMMPGLAGLPRFRALRERLPDTPVLFISGFSREAAVQDLLDAGAEELIHKPFRIETLARAVRAALEKGARATPAAS